MERRRVFGWTASRLAVSAVIAVWAACSGTAQASSLNDAVVAELNFARTHPVEYAQALRRYRTYFEGQVVREPGSGPGVMTVEGVGAVDQAIVFLDRQRPLKPFLRSAILAEAAADHAREQGPSGAIGHEGAGGSRPDERISRHGVWRGMVAEDISYGYDTAAGVVRALIVDDGVANRGHRANIFNSYLGFAGAGCSPHAIYRYMCVVDFAAQIGPGAR